MSDWSLTDYSGPAGPDDTSDPDPLPITSIEQLRTELNRLAGLPPRIVYLTASDGRMLRVGIGGPFGGFAAHDHTLANVRIARPRTAEARGPIEFAYWCQPCVLNAQQLFSAAELIELLANYVETEAFPAWLGWDR